MADKNSFLDKCLSIHSRLLTDGVASGIKFRANESECTITANNKSMTFTESSEIDIDSVIRAFEKF